MGSTAVKVIGSAIVTDYIRNGKRVGHIVEMFDPQGEFLATRKYFTNEEFMSRLMVGKAVVSIFGTGWFCVTCDYERTTLNYDNENGRDVWHFVITDRGDFGRN